MMKSVLILNFVIFFTGITLESSGKNYYIDSNNGLDTNKGTSTDEAWQSYSAIDEHSFNPGDTLFFKCGSLFNGPLQFYSSGVNGNPIVLTSYGTGDRPVLRNPGELYAIQLQGSWLIIDKLLIKDTYKAGIEISGDSEHNIIRNCEITNVGLGLLVYGAHNKITNNYIHDLHIVLSTPGNDDDYGATGVFLFAGNTEISYNTFINCIDESYDYGHDGGAVDFCVSVDSSCIHHNYAEGCCGFFEIGVGTANDNIVAYNVSVNNSMFGALNLSGKYACVITNLHIENNTIIENDDSEMSYIILWYSTPGKANTVYFRNNIVYIDNFWYFSNDSSYIHENNLYCYVYPYTDFGFTFSSTEIIADPLFEDAANGNYRLTNDSPAKNAGLNLGYSLDFDNNPVPSGSTADIGAYEYQETLQISMIKKQKTINIYPNPATDYFTIHSEENSVLQVFDLDGHLVIQQQLSENEYHVRTDHFLSGSYVIKITNNNQTHSEILIIK